MPKHFEQPVANYKNVEEFQHMAIHTLTNLYGQHGRKFTEFDFGQKEKEVDGKKHQFYFCIGYQTGEKVPPEAARGQTYTPAQAQHEREIAEKQKTLDAAGAGLVNATDFAVELAVKKGINLVDVAKGLPAGTKIGKKEVEAYLKANPPQAPEKDKAVNEKTETDPAKSAA